MDHIFLLVQIHYYDWFSSLKVLYLFLIWLNHVKMLYYIFFHFFGDLLELLRERFVPDLHRLFFEVHDLRLLRCLERFTPDF